MNPLRPTRVAVACGVLALLALTATLAATLLGSTTLDLAAALADGTGPNPERDILFGHRLPRAVLAAVTGGALAIVGAAFQAVLRNPLADPFILGVSGGAALGATVVIALGVSTVGVLGALTVPAASFGGAALSLALVFALSFRGRRARPNDILLIGVVFNAFASALIMFLKTVVSAQKAQEMLYWLMGTLSIERVGWLQINVVAAIVFAGAAGLLVLAPRLNAMTFGDDDARGLGVPVERTRRWVFLSCSLMIGAVVSVTGFIGFVGLVIPHAVRLTWGPDHRLLMPASFLLGAAFLPLADLLTRLLFPVVATATPVGVVTAFLGAPAFVWLLRRRRGALAGGGS